jgi:prevent-host-death family protein
MCYFRAMPESVGVRELRQNLSVYLRRVKAGERLIVTERNLPVAELVPLDADLDPIERMIAEGRLWPPTRSLRDLPLPTEVPGDPYAGTRALQEMREDRF